MTRVLMLVTVAFLWVATVVAIGFAAHVVWALLSIGWRIVDALK